MAKNKGYSNNVSRIVNGYRPPLTGIRNSTEKPGGKIKRTSAVKK